MAQRLRFPPDHKNYFVWDVEDQVVHSPGGTLSYAKEVIKGYPDLDLVIVEKRTLHREVDENGNPKE
jgi:hypothetical protein